MKSLEVKKGELETIFEEKRSRLERELGLYKQEEYLKINIEIQERKENGFNILEDVRLKYREKKLELIEEVSKLEGQRDALQTNLEYPKEIQRLNNIILELIKNQNNYLNFIEKK